MFVFNRHVNAADTVSPQERVNAIMKSFLLASSLVLSTQSSDSPSIYHHLFVRSIDCRFMGKVSAVCHLQLHL
ncbi:hypothetical protein SISNIDRAFT_450289 [Sistotremastrum niveocremeum HHB9708]|uniref:Uncharacterized protein n=1 Tax=Sistotremastrum niveocremeum HHB9708 TaxID=1314777 RepID=A0A164Z2J5_9AGAM|nr:hypothetical protein SISNIDRAFT_450289 [Sistotremastrum niveocremeum HHB9708]